MNTKKYFEYYDVEPVPNIKAMLQGAVDDAGDHIAYRYKKRGGHDVIDVTYSEFQNMTFALGSALLEKGYGLDGQHIGIVAINSFEWILTYLTVLQSASVFVPIDSELPAKDIFYIALTSDTKVLFYSEKHEKNYGKIKIKCLI